MAEAAISNLLQLLGGQVIEKVKSVRGVEWKVQSLKDEWRWMQSFLNANKKQYEDARVRNWISEIRELAQDAQDTIEMFLLNVENARNMSFLNNCTNFGKRMHHLPTIGKDLRQVEELRRRLQVQSQQRLSPGQKDEHEDNVNMWLIGAFNTSLGTYGIKDLGEAEAAISTLLQLLGEELIQKVKSLRGVEGKVELLKIELKAMQSFLKDANKKQYEDERARNWIWEIRELAQDAQETIEMFLLNVENARSMSFPNKCTNFGKRMHHLHTIGKEIDFIREKLAVINTSRETYGIKDLGETEESGWRLQVESQLRLSPGKNDEHLVGIREDMAKLLQESILDEKKKGLSIAIIEGMSGIGKSTLAREIYNHTNVITGRFDCRAWGVVSSEFRHERTIKQLIFQLLGSEEEKQKLQELEDTTKDKLDLLRKLKEMLGEQLKGKSYFIVLDDVWNTEHLESLITDFPDEEEKASRILVTTRRKIITKYDQYMHRMKLLDSKKGWELLLKKALIGSTSNGKCPEELESIGREILEKCHGLPLEISLVGGLLVGTQTKSDWEQVLNQINFYNTTYGEFAFLELSYQNLSPQLKSCFLCLSFFKEGFTIPAKRLVNIWDAQGFIQPEGSRSIDEIGRGYLNELINRSLLQIQDLSYGDRVKSCRIHDFVREVCLENAWEEIDLEIVVENEISTRSRRKPRHRVVYGKNLETCLSNQNKHIRSLFLLNDQGGHYKFVAAPSNYWKSYQLLKTLELDGFLFERLPNSFRLLIGLKCLRIHYYYVYEYSLDLPSWLDHLKNLEVLDMGRCRVLFPILHPLKMERLRYLSAIIERGPTEISSWKNMACLKHISHKDWMRYCASNLTSGCRLQELSIRFDGDEEREELMKMKASLEKQQNLVILHLWGRIIEMALVVPNHLNSLTELVLRDFEPQCLAATFFPPNLSHLTLYHFRLYNDQMAELGKLPKLSFLKLKDIAYMDDFMCDGFPFLEALTFIDMWDLKFIIIEEGGMPKLKHLRIRNCPILHTSNLPERIHLCLPLF